MIQVQHGEPKNILMLLMERWGMVAYSMSDLEAIAFLKTSTLTWVAVYEICVTESLSPYFLSFILYSASTRPHATMMTRKYVGLN